MVCHPHPDTKARILEALAAHGGLMSNAQIAAAIGSDMKVVRPVTASMTESGTLRSKTYGHGVLYRLRGPQDNPPPVRNIGTGNFHGIDWSRSTTRPGCLDYARIPSRRGDKRIYPRTSMGA